MGPNCKGDPQVCDPAGLEFRLSDPPLLFMEGFYKYNQKQGLAGTIPERPQIAIWWISMPKAASLSPA